MWGTDFVRLLVQAGVRIINIIIMLNGSDSFTTGRARFDYWTLFHDYNINNVCSFCNKSVPENREHSISKYKKRQNQYEGR